jgi:hypothetical protein
MQTRARGQAHYLRVGNAGPGNSSMPMDHLLPERFVSTIGPFDSVQETSIRFRIERFLPFVGISRI